MQRLRGLTGLGAPSSSISTLWQKAERDDNSRSSAKPSRLKKVESRLDNCKKRNRAARGVLVDHAALHYKHNATNGGDVFQRASIEPNDVPLKARGDLANLIAHAQRFSAPPVF